MSAASVSLGIPAKTNKDSEGNANGISGRRRRDFGSASDADTPIVSKPFVFVKKRHPERSVGTLLLAEKGLWEKGGSLSLSEREGASQEALDMLG